jgi:hypothetical protein
MLLLQDERSRWMRYNVYIDLHTSKARYELKVVLLHLAHKSKEIRGFINILLVDFFIDKSAP